MSEFVLVFVQLAVVTAGLAVMGAIVWTAQNDGFQAHQSLAPSRTTPPVGRNAREAAQPPSAPATRTRRPAYAGRR
jgi:hypothetical protein